MMTRFLATTLLLFASLAHADEPALPQTPPTEHPATQRPSLMDPPSARDLAEYRKKYPTVLTRHGPPPASWRDSTPLSKPAEVSEVEYESDGLKLKAWMSAVPADGKMHPAIVFCHGGFWFSNEDWDAIKPLIDAGFVVMMPRVRGENGNPGDFELFGHEVDDVNAAGRFLAGVKGVDKERLFVSGHSAGGGLAALAVMMEGTPFKLSAPIAPMLELRDSGSWMDERHHDLICFDATNKRETEQRTALLFTAGLRAPIHIFLGDEDGTARTEYGLVMLAQFFRKEATLNKVRGGHSDSLPNAMPKLIALLNDFSPTRHLDCELPLGWIGEAAPADEKHLRLFARSSVLGARVAVYQVPKTLCPRGWAAMDYAKAGMKNPDNAPDWKNLSFIPPKPIENLGRSAAAFDVSGKSATRDLHRRIYVVETDHFFAVVHGEVASEGFINAAAEFEAIAASVVERE